MVFEPIILNFQVWISIFFGFEHRCYFLQKCAFSFYFDLPFSFSNSQLEITTSWDFLALMKLKTSLNFMFLWWYRVFCSNTLSFLVFYSNMVSQLTFWICYGRNFALKHHLTCRPHQDRVAVFKAISSIEFQSYLDALSSSSF